MKGSLYVIILVLSLGAYAQRVLGPINSLPQVDSTENFEVQVEESLLDISDTIIEIKRITEQNPGLKLRLEYELEKLKKIQRELIRIEELAKSETGSPGV